MKFKCKSYLRLGILTSLFWISCTKNNDLGTGVETLPNTVILEWNEIAYQAFGGTSYQHSLMAARINAMVHLAMHDALNAIYPKYETYALTILDASADPVAAASSAAHLVLIHEIPEKQAFLDSVLQVTLSKIPQGDARTRGIELGKNAAQAVIQERTNDGAAGNPVVPVPPADNPGDYQPVPPFDFYFAPYWEHVKLFGLQAKDQFRCPAPPSLQSDAYTNAFNEVKEKGSLKSGARTQNETDYAQFWYEFSEAGWNRVTRIVAANEKLPLFETARLFALVDMAIADAYTAGWDSKLYYNLWRPYTAIRNANSDLNEETFEDLLWEPLLTTPPIQDYPSTHSALGGAAATVLGSILGDNTAFTMPSPTAVPSGSTRSFVSFSQAARENADSRVMAGIHFRFACDAGLNLGNYIGEWMVQNHLKPR